MLNRLPSFESLTPDMEKMEVSLMLTFESMSQLMLDLTQAKILNYLDQSIYFANLLSDKITIQFKNVTPRNVEMMEQCWNQLKIGCIKYGSGKWNTE